ncbi:hypothetical protein F5051DRAFT_416618 [Lentinula edodes]|nr:hypothetical protein F5051DRAFT_416618 [Lentinula edodes]
MCGNIPASIWSFVRSRSFVLCCLSSAIATRLANKIGQVVTLKKDDVVEIDEGKERFRARFWKCWRRRSGTKFRESSGRGASGLVSARERLISSGFSYFENGYRGKMGERIARWKDFTI